MVYKYWIYDYIIESNCPCKYLHDVKDETQNNKNRIIVEIHIIKPQQGASDNQQFVYKCDNNEFVGRRNLLCD